MSDSTPGTHEETPTTCAYCDLPGNYLCDFPIGARILGFTRNGSIEQNTFSAVADAKQPMFKCDIPLCEDHRVRVGHIFARGRHGYNDSIDRCLEHAGVREQPVKPITDEEAATERRGIRAVARRRLFQCIDDATSASNGGTDASIHH